MNLYTYLGPWQQGPPELGWVPPEGALATSDLRPMELQAAPTGTPGIGMFVTDRKLGADYDLLAEGHPQEARVNGRARAAWNRLVGVKGVQGETPAELLWHQLTWGADPTGADRPKPLLPGREGGCSWFRLHLLGPARGVPFVWDEDAEATARVRDVLQRDFAQVMDDADAGRLRDRDHHRRVLDYLCEEYKIDDWQQFVPANRRRDIPGRLKHATTYTANFNSADSADLPSPFTDVVGDIGITSNRAQNRTSVDNCRSRYDADLSSANHYTQITAVAEGNGSNPQDSYFAACCRFASAATTFYNGWQRRNASTARTIQKCVAGTFTTLTSNNTPATVPYAVRLDANGSSLALSVAGTQVLATTDTVITGNLRAGFGFRSSNSAGTGTGEAADDFITSDLAVTTIVSTRSRSRLDGSWYGSTVVRRQ